MSGPRILLVDDEEDVLRFLAPTLAMEGYEISSAQTGAAALQILARERVSAVILDLGLPDLDGVDVILAAAELSRAPIIVLSARGAEADKISALDAGAEDYLAKPFSVGELMARLRVLLRSTRKRSTDLVGPEGLLTLDVYQRIAKLPWGNVKLSRRETEFLRLLIAQEGGVVTHREIILGVWGDVDRADAQFVRVLTGQVRHKIEEDPSSPQIVITVPGVGYRLGSGRRAPEAVSRPWRGQAFHLA